MTDIVLGVKVFGQVIEDIIACLPGDSADDGTMG